MTIKINEIGGVSIARQLVKTDLSGCLVPQCTICKCNIPGASHNRSGIAYNIKCKLCEEKGVDASYEEDSGDNLVWRQMQHSESVNGKNLCQWFNKTSSSISSILEMSTISVSRLSNALPRLLTD